MSGYLSDSALMICQSVISNQLNLLKLIGSCDREQLNCVLDELNSALSGEPLEQVRNQRKELERIDQEEWEKVFGAKKEKVGSGQCDPGPKKGPSSSAKIQAKTKSVVNVLKEIHSFLSEKFDEHQETTTEELLRHPEGSDRHRYHEGAMAAYNNAARSVMHFIERKTRKPDDQPTKDC